MKTSQRIKVVCKFDSNSAQFRHTFA
jgi:hypothetical protein